MEVRLRTDSQTDGLISFCEKIKELFGDKLTIVEIGSFAGESSVIFAKMFPKSTIYCVDPFVPYYDSSDPINTSDFSLIETEFDYRVKDYPNILKIKKISLDFNTECDIVYIDGCHKYECVKEDIIHWSKYVNMAICGHDYQTSDKDTISPHTSGVRVAIHETIGEPDYTFSDGSWIKKIRI